MGRIMSLDYGSRTIGVAVTDPMQLIVSPLETVVRDQENKLRESLRRIVGIAREQDAELILLGLPLHMDGRQGERAEKTIEFKHLLERRLEAAGLQLPVVLWDERLTTAAADDILSESEIPQEDRKKYIDKIAAALLLEDWLAAKQAGAAREEAAEGGLNGRE